MHDQAYNELAAAVASDENLTQRIQSKLFARVPPPEALSADERYDVDLAVPSFTYRGGGEPLAWGPAQLIATFELPTNTWLCGKFNSSIHPVGVAQLASFWDAHAILAPLRTAEPVRLEPDFAASVATWIAARAGWLGAYPAVTGTTIAYLALQLTTYSDHSFEPTDNDWCSLCGRVPEQVAVLLAPHPNTAICGECVELALTILAESDDKRKAEGTTDQDMPSCLLCGEKRPRLYFAYAGLCYRCIRFAEQLIEKQPHSP
ncbi:MAG: ClpX C4-type zinc finger protein [Bdellovibrionales bacterium]|nr:ClpX C4-type zinc finger protein [Bdellovibrionales bacterium]